MMSMSVRFDREELEKAVRHWLGTKSTACNRNIESITWGFESDDRMIDAVYVDLEIGEEMRNSQYGG